jgi:hypothetical protein
MGLSSPLTKSVTTYNQLFVVNNSSPIFYIPIQVSKTIEDARHDVGDIFSEQQTRR